MAFPLAFSMFSGVFGTFFPHLRSGTRQSCGNRRTSLQGRVGWRVGAGAFLPDGGCVRRRFGRVGGNRTVASLVGTV